MALNILIVDDEVNLAELTSYMLEDYGHSTFLANSGEAGVDVVLNNKIDLIISDYNMPDMSGLEMLELIKSEGNQALPVSILVSGGSKKNIPQEGLIGLNIVQVLEKPFEEEDILQVIKTVDS